MRGCIQFVILPNYYMPNCVYLYLLPLLLHIIDTLLAYVADLFVTSVCGLLRVRGQGVKRQISRSQVRIRYVEKLYLFEPYF